MAQTEGKRLPDTIRSLIELLLNDLKLSATEKISRLLTSFSLVFIISLLALGSFLFFSYAGAAFLATVLPSGFANMIIAGIYILLIVIVVIFRRALLEDPITRLLSKVILSKPVNRKTPSLNPQTTDREDEK